MNEMQKLIELLNSYEIPHEVVEYPHLGFFQIFYPNCDKPIGSIIYLNSRNIESMCLHKYKSKDVEWFSTADEDEDLVEGYLTAEKVFARIVKHYSEKSKLA